MTNSAGYIKVNGNLVLKNGVKIPGVLYYSGKEFKGFIPDEHDYKRGLLFKQMYEPDAPSFKGLNALFPGGWIDDPDVPLNPHESHNANPKITDNKPKQKARILIVEDVEDEREILSEYFVSNDYLVLMAKTCEEAYEVATQQMPDVILMDVALPGKSGIDLCQQLKASDRLKCIPVIILTGLDEMNHKIHGYVAGAKQWLTKPCELKNVEMSISRALRRSNSNRKTAECSREGFSSSKQISFEFDDPSCESDI